MPTRLAPPIRLSPSSPRSKPTISSSCSKPGRNFGLGDEPPARRRADLPESEQLQYQALKTNYETILDHQKYIGGELEKARFTKAKMESEQASAYQIVDPPVVPQSPDLSLNRLLGLLLVGLAVAVGLGFSVIAIATWLGAGRRAAEATSALPAWAESDDDPGRADSMTLVLTLLATFLIAGQTVRKWTAPVILLLAVWIGLVVGVHLFILR